MVKELTQRQAAVLRHLDDYLERHGYPPTLREIADHFGFSSLTAVRDHLRALEEKGHLRRAADKSRGIVRTRRRGLPLIGEVAAGTPIMAEENIRDVVVLEEYFGRERSTFVLRVRGESMRGAGIHDGDLVVVHQQPTLEAGEIGVVCLGSEATVKRVFPEGEMIRLQPENEFLAPAFVSRDDPDFRIAGRVIGVIRKF
jgi:repressor LexA